MTAEPVPQTPRKPVAPSTHRVELQRLALQQQLGHDFDPLRVQAIIWVYRAYNAVAHKQAEELRPLGVSPTGFHVLMALVNTPSHTLQPREIAARLLVSRPSVTGLLDTLQERGYIERRPHPDDGRRVLVGLTDKARRVLDLHLPTHYATQAELFGDLTAGELATLVCLLRKIRGATPETLRDDATAAETPPAPS